MMNQYGYYAILASKIYKACNGSGEKSVIANAVWNEQRAVVRIEKTTLGASWTKAWVRARRESAILLSSLLKKQNDC